MNNPIPAHVTRAVGLGGVAPSIFLRPVRSVLYGVVQGHHDSMEVPTEPGKGSAFRATLPLKQPTAPAANSNHA